MKSARLVCITSIFVFLISWVYADVDDLKKKKFLEEQLVKFIKKEFRSKGNSTDDGDEPKYNPENDETYVDDDNGPIKDDIDIDRFLNKVLPSNLSHVQEIQLTDLSKDLEDDEGYNDITDYFSHINAFTKHCKGNFKNYEKRFEEFYRIRTEKNDEYLIPEPGDQIPGLKGNNDVYFRHTKHFLLPNGTSIMWTPNDSSKSVLSNPGEKSEKTIWKEKTKIGGSVLSGTEDGKRFVQQFPKKTKLDFNSNTQNIGETTVVEGAEIKRIVPIKQKFMRYMNDTAESIRESAQSIKKGMRNIFKNSGMSFKSLVDSAFDKIKNFGKDEVDIQFEKFISKFGLDKKQIDLNYYLKNHDDYRERFDYSKAPYI